MYSLGHHKVTVVMIFAVIITVEKSQYNVKCDLEAVAIAGQLKSSIDWKVKVNFNKQKMSTLQRPLEINFNYKYKYRHKYRHKYKHKYTVFTNTGTNTDAKLLLTFKTEKLKQWWQEEEVLPPVAFL